MDVRRECWEPGCSRVSAAWLGLGLGLKYEHDDHSDWCSDHCRGCGYGEGDVMSDHVECDSRAVELQRLLSEATRSLADAERRVEELTTERDLALQMGITAIENRMTENREARSAMRALLATRERAL